jgi:peptidoglycan/LPS O-acetylase OafA/YrhL
VTNAPEPPCELVPNTDQVQRPRSQRKVSWDVMRVVAIYAVVIQHITHQAPINHPELGPNPIVVPLQFGASTLLVISAYFVCVTVRRGNTGRWLWNRLARLLPAYLLAVVATYVITRVGVAVFEHYRFDGLGGLLFGQPVSGSVVGGPPVWYLPNKTDLFSNLFMVEAWSPGFHWIDASYWTLPVQVMGFTAAAVLWKRGWWRGARLPVLLWSLVIVPVIIRFAWRGDDSAQWIKSVFDGLSLHRVALFGAGVAIWLWTRERMSGKQLAVYLIAVLVSQDAHGYFADTWSTVALGVVFVGIVAAAGGADWNLGRLAPVISWLASISYGVYLVHQQIGFVMARLLLDDGIGPWGRIGVCLALALALGWLLTRLVERPAHQWLTTVSARDVLRRLQPQGDSSGRALLPSTRPASHATIFDAGPLISLDPAAAGTSMRQVR